MNKKTIRLINNTKKKKCTYSIVFSIALYLQLTVWNNANLLICFQSETRLYHKCTMLIVLSYTHSIHVCVTHCITYAFAGNPLNFAPGFRIHCDVVEMRMNITLYVTTFPSDVGCGKLTCSRRSDRR
jgi:hypothetical protein